jgi:cytidine deaminase
LDDLVAQARTVAHRAHAPYSSFRVGAAVRDADGAIFLGCNVESASFGLTMCAERNAIFSAVAAGARRPLVALALTCLDATGRAAACRGACRQVIAEHLAPDARIVIDGGGQFSVADLLPFCIHPGATAGS